MGICLKLLVLGLAYVSDDDKIPMRCIVGKEVLSPQKDNSKKQSLSRSSCMVF